MKIRQAVFSVALLGLLLFVAGCAKNRVSAEKEGPTVYSRDFYPTGASRLDSGVGVALADMDGDGDLDLVSVAPNSVKYFENQGGNFVDRGVIAETEASRLDSGAGIAIGDVDADGVLDIVIATPNVIKVIKNSVPQKR